jgi:uncharacterized protein YbaR (Trm112 family)
MALDPKLLEILVDPVDKSALEVIDLPPAIAAKLVEKYREQFGEEEPEVSVGLASTGGRVYPVVSDIPVMLADHALDRSEVQAASTGE